MSNKVSISFFLLLCCFTSCEQARNPILISDLKESCSVFDSLSISVWRNVYEGTYIGSFCLKGDDKRYSFKSVNRLPLLKKPEIEYSWENKEEHALWMPMPYDSCRVQLERVLLLSRISHIVQLKKSSTEFYFTKGDWFHPIKRYDIRE